MVLIGVVRESLNQVIFDCSTIAETYKCGCDEDEEKEPKGSSAGVEESTIQVERKEGEVSEDDDDAPEIPSETALPHRTNNFQFKEEGLTRGG